MSGKDRREAVRIDAVDIEGRLADPSGDEWTDCIIRDFSRNGCCITARGVNHFGNAIKIRIKGVDDELLGNIVWREPGKIGVEFEWQQPATADDRRELRRAVCIPVRVSDHERLMTTRATLVDASKSGCQIETPDVYKLPDDVIIDVMTLRITIGGIIRWRSGERAGVLLDWSKAHRTGSKPTGKSFVHLD